MKDKDDKPSHQLGFTKEPYLVSQARKLIELTKQGHFFYESVEQTCDWIEKVYLDQALKDLNIQ